MVGIVSRIGDRSPGSVTYGLWQLSSTGVSWKIFFFVSPQSFLSSKSKNMPDKRRQTQRRDNWPSLTNHLEVTCQQKLLNFSFPLRYFEYTLQRSSHASYIFGIDQGKSRKEH